ncbi:IS200/IS605 family accessory protein TnpB-related protein [Phormidium sp. CCY1219]|uniref:IS200/IS605 family accessory protein TnpB-related protein n=1 Tax=Phormidium sp. CCY1219 TaxID=2886104 RepID=UPI002D1E6EED|nr:IS200/IS605 family accessory protein TnpB-related protein [Phormidium sp. CCY1219]MEB3829975.1 IS200/IS605 family accessory protein TnpB-related protein [Phormidium sp. CCY1219]
MRQGFFHRGQVCSNTKLYHLVADSDAYQQMRSTKIACSLIRQVCQAWSGYFKAYNNLRINPEKYLTNPKIPKYKDKLKGSFLALYKRSKAIYKKPLAEIIFHRFHSDIINYVKSNGLDILVVGKNEGWKQKVNIGKRNNQNFVQILDGKLIEMLDYKCQLAGIKLVIRN